MLLLRLLVGLAFIFHGGPKVADVAGFATYLNLPVWLAGVAAYTEVIGGALLILGPLTPLAALSLAVQMLVALFMVHIPAGHPFVASQGPSFETAMFYLVLMVAFMLAGPGAYSLDASRARPTDERPEARRPVTSRRRGTAQ